MADLVFAPVADRIMDATYSCYDGACGTGGMLTVAQDRLQKIAAQTGKKVSIHLFGQELQPETYAIAKADMMLKGDGEEAMHIAFGSTLSSDQHVTRSFEILSGKWIQTHDCEHEPKPHEIRHLAAIA